MYYEKLGVSTILKLWEESGLREALGDNPNVQSVVIYRLYTADDLKHAFKGAAMKLKNGGIRQQSELTLLESVCRYATGIAKRRHEDTLAVQAEMDAAEAQYRAEENANDRISI